MTVHAYIQDGRVMQLVRPQVADIDILQPNETGELVRVVEAGQVVPLPMLYTPEFIASLRAVPDDQLIELGDSYDETGETFGPPPAPPTITAEQARAVRDGLLTDAALRIAPLQDAADLDDATAAEAAALKAWKQYRVALSRIEQQVGFPGAVEWPAAPS